MACGLIGLINHYVEVQNQCEFSSRHYDKAMSAVQMNGSTEHQMELGKDVVSHPPYSTFFFSKGLCLMLRKNMMESLT